MTGATSTPAPVLVAVGRSGSDAAVRKGAFEAGRTGRRLVLVHVASTGSYADRLGHDALAVASTRSHHLIDADRAETRLLVGDVVPQVAALADSSALLVTERRAAGTVLRPSTSVTASLAAASDVPLLSVPSGWVEDPDHGVVTVGIDLAEPPEAAVALRAAVVASLLRHATLRVVVATPSTSVGLGLVDGPGVESLREQVAALVAAAGGDQCDVAVEVVGGRPEQHLVEDSLGSALLVVGRHRPWLRSGSRLGPVARSVLRDAACPVLLAAPAAVHARPTHATS